MKKFLRIKTWFVRLFSPDKKTLGAIGEDLRKVAVTAMLWSSFFGHADQMVGLCTGGQLGGRAGQRFVL
ncbi:hypothetical protein MZB81_21405, partial [Klebsiella pneumoniae]|nr:hypothetical protein [Klebsiella pneumoniae]